MVVAVLRDAEAQRLLIESPVWLRRLLTAALETCISRGDLLRLQWEDIDEESGTIIPDGGRLKTSVTQAAPLTDAVRTILADIKVERARAKVHNIETAHLIFTRESGDPIAGDMITKASGKACKGAGVKDFHFHDPRHTVKTSWARRGIPVESAMLGAGHKSVQMHQAYVHLQASDIGKAFGTAKVVSIESKKAPGGKK
jgi:integrase